MMRGARLATCPYIPSLHTKTRPNSAARLGCPQCTRFSLISVGPGDRARQSVLSAASTVRRRSRQAPYASAADLPPGDKRLAEMPVLRPARPSWRSRQSTLRTRKARGSTTATLPRQTPLSFAHSTHTRNHPWMFVPPALRANYDPLAVLDVVPHLTPAHR